MRHSAVGTQNQPVTNPRSKKKGKKGIKTEKSKTVVSAINNQLIVLRFLLSSVFQRFSDVRGLNTECFPCRIRVAVQQLPCRISLHFFPRSSRSLLP